MLMFPYKTRKAYKPLDRHSHDFSHDGHLNDFEADHFADGYAEGYNHAFNDLSYYIRWRSFKKEEPKLLACILVKSHARAIPQVIIYGSEEWDRVKDQFKYWTPIFPYKKHSRE